MSMEDILKSLPDEQRAALEESNAAAEAQSRLISDEAKEQGLPLAVREGKEVYINVNLLESLAAQEAISVLFGSASADDFGRFLVQLGDYARAAHQFVS